MNSVPFIYINFIALFCHALLLFSIIRANKTKELGYLVMIILAFIVHICAILYMRLWAPPGQVDFWGRLSQMALFVIPVFLYFFIDSYVGGNNRKTKIVLIAMAIIQIYLVTHGVIIEPPIIFTAPDGKMLVSHKMNWLTFIPHGYNLFVMYLSAALLRKGVAKTGIQASGMGLVIVGIIVAWAGTSLMPVPENIFPWDALAESITALLCVLALYRKRSLHLNLFVSRLILMPCWLMICFVLSINYSTPLQALMDQLLPGQAEIAHTVVVVIFASVFGILYRSLVRVWDVIFNRDELRRDHIAQFSRYASLTLSTNKIVFELMRVIKHELPIQNIYILAREKSGNYELKYSASGVGNTFFALSEEGPIFEHFKNGHSYFVLDDLRKTKQYDDLLQQEPLIFQQLNIRCIVAAKGKDTIQALILIPMKDTGTQFSLTELDFMDTVISIATTAMHNAVLYERVYMDARMDSLTGIYNYRHFLERVHEEFAVCQDSSIALLYLDIDDFSLFNHLYGQAEGDYILTMTAHLIADITGSRGSVYRHSGKVFALLLPDHGAEQAYSLAKEIQRGSEAINHVLKQKKMKSMTLSGGISVGPHTAKSAKELMEQADLALFNAKKSRKNEISIFRPYLIGGSKIAERVADILERNSKTGEDSYGLYSKMILALAATIDAKDHYTYNHSHNVARYASTLAAAIDLSDDHIRIVHEASLLHDIGKISIPETILGKTSALSGAEYAIIKEHVNNSIDIIRHLPSMDYLIPTAIGHHERWDGKGYPHGIAGEKIPVLARCLAIADAFDAMTTNRTYRRGMSLEDAVREIKKNANTQFDPRLAQTFVDLVLSGEIFIESANRKISVMGIEGQWNQSFSMGNA